MAGSSTGGTLILELVTSSYFNNKLHPKNLFLIDPIVLPSNKLQSVAGIVGPMLVYIEVEQTVEEDKYWYHFRPQETVNELNKLMKEVRQDLEKEIQKNRDAVMENRQHIAILEDRAGMKKIGPMKEH